MATSSPGGARLPGLRVVAGAARLVRLYTLAVAVAAALIVLAALADDLPLASVLLIGGAAAVPPVLLFLFSQALTALAELPARVRDTPAGVRGHADEAQRLFARRGPGSLLFLPFRLLRLSSGARETLMPHAAVLPLLSAPFLAATGFAALVGLAELLLGLVALLDLASS